MAENAGTRQVLVGDLQSLLSNYKQQVEKMRVHRNKRIAHHDLETALEVYKLADVTLREIEDALQTLRDFMNKIESTFEGPTTAYTAGHIVEGADALFYYLKLGLEAHKRSRVNA